MGACTIVVASTSAGAAEFGPVDPALGDGSSGSLRDIVENDATHQGSDGSGCVPNGSTCGDTIVLRGGSTYTLTCSGGGALAHGNTPLRIESDAVAPAVVLQACAGERTLDQAGDERVMLVNVQLVGPGGGHMSPPCTTEEPNPSRTWSTTTDTNRTDETLDPATVEVTRVQGVLVGPDGDIVVYETTAAGPPGWPQFADAVAQARAVVSASAPAVVGPSLVDQRVDDSLVERDILDHYGVSITSAQTFGPATFLIGLDQSEFYFIPGPNICTNRNDNTDTLVFSVHTTQTVTTTTSTYVVYGTAAPTFTG